MKTIYAIKFEDLKVLEYWISFIYKTDMVV